MTYFARIIKSLAASPSSIVHLGSGSCAEHALYQSLEPSQIIYVEPDQYLVEAAKRTIHDTPFARVIPCAIATTIGRRVLNIANNRKFSSLLTPEKLLDFYPNIVVEQQIKVETTTIETLCRTENIEKAPNNLLVAELQGLENEVFCAVDEEILNRFKWVIIRSSEQLLYKPNPETQTGNLSDAMRKAGFRVQVFTEDFPPFINVICTRDDAATEAKALRAEKQELHGTINELQENLALQKQELEQAHNKLEQAHNEIQSVTRERDVHRQQVKDLTDELEEKSAEVLEMQQILKMNSKLALKSDADLRNLQLQYSAVVQKHEEQQVLLAELKQKLRQASLYYRKLNLKNLVIDSDLPDRDVSPQDETEADQEDDI